MFPASQRGSSGLAANLGILSPSSLQILPPKSQLCSRLSTDGLSSLIPSSPERPAPFSCSGSWRGLWGRGPPVPQETPTEPTPWGWAGVWPARLSHAPTGKGSRGIFPFLEYL